MKDDLGQDGNEVKDVLTYEGHYYQWPRSFAVTGDGPVIIINTQLSLYVSKLKRIQLKSYQT